MRRTRARHLLRLTGAGALVAALLSVPTIASAHIERPSYWPLPGPDCSISPCAGGAVPTPRTLASAIVPSTNSTTRVVCQPDSMTRLQTSINNALAHGYDIRPHDHRTFTQTQANQLLAINQTLFSMCTYNEIQPAVTDSGNNDRVVIMPGLYTEPESRIQPTNDPACAQYKITDNTG